MAFVHCKHPAATEAGREITKRIIGLNECPAPQIVEMPEGTIVSVGEVAHVGDL
jgi:hypothetical protein